ncbi:hypothetical protein [Gilvimarinus xylanilyticus]|uniref:CcmD family protein n=1 Tax=Gilvimarinus xylanilyticus TaxID=2944139 RepID=A0A9X2I0B9_9GAMM|nr:hypothetical protein [Gilvimarinus xylanilyticus]MCP8898238.1 hypothetical protein [Gilvimarinus xylanilyticus]
MKMLMKFTSLCTLALFSLFAQAHPHHSEHAASSHIHFSVGSFALVAFVLLAFWFGSRYFRSRERKHHAKQRKDK